MIAIESMAQSTRDPGRNVRAICAGHAFNRSGSHHLKEAEEKGARMTAEEFHSLPITLEDQADFEKELECDWGEWSEWDEGSWITTYSSRWDPK